MKIEEESFEENGIDVTDIGNRKGIANFLAECRGLISARGVEIWPRGAESELEVVKKLIVDSRTELP